MSGLDFPVDLAAWQAWQMRQRGIKARVKSRIDALPWHGRKPIHLTANRGSGCDVLVTLEAVTPTAVLALLRPLEHLSGLSIRIASPVSIADIVPGGHWIEGNADIDAVTVLGNRATVVLSTGHYLPFGAAAYRGIQASRPEKRARFLTVQHGLLTPKAPPLASGTQLLAWSESDAEFWRSGRTDIETTVVGSQLLWEAAKAADGNDSSMTARSASDRPVFLGQLHGAELDRAELAASTEQFCRENGAVYRPHPAEHDRRSRAWHRKWAASGIEIDSGTRRLADLDSPVVSAFSTGILEAAARGLPAWAYHANPPEWLRDFWQRYDMRQWGDSPTPTPTQPDTEPAQTIAKIVRTIVEAR